MICKKLRGTPRRRHKVLERHPDAHVYNLGQDQLAKTVGFERAKNGRVSGFCVYNPIPNATRRFASGSRGLGGTRPSATNSRSPLIREDAPICIDFAQLFSTAVSFRWADVGKAKLIANPTRASDRIFILDPEEGD